MDLDLRIVLLVIGALFIVGLIVIDSMKRKKAEQLPYRRFSEGEDFDLPSMSTADDDPDHDALDELRTHDGTRVDPVELSNPLPEPLSEPLEELQDADVDSVAVNEAEPDYVAATAIDSAVTDIEPEPERDEMAESSAGQAPESEPDQQQVKAEPALVLSLLILAPKGEQFRGSQIKMALREAGFSFGKMDIFHQLVGDEPLVSVANVVEPGTFVLEELADFRTPGLVVFAQLPAPLAGEEVFGRWYKAAKKVNAVLGGRLTDLHQKPMGREIFEQLQQQAEEITAIPFGGSGA